MKQHYKVFELALIGHPDKVCDLVSHRIAQTNLNGRNAIECMWGNKRFMVSGETDKKWTLPQLTKFVKNILFTEIGLNQLELDSITVINNLNIQSSEINEVVGDNGTGDNGVYYNGYHKIYSPIIRLMKRMCLSLTKDLLESWNYRTDGKFIFKVDKKGNITELTMNCASYACKTKSDEMELYQHIRKFTGHKTKIVINPKGDWYKCFGFADTGLTGRKIACDATCGLYSHGGGAMFGKDISKADVTVPLYLGLIAENFQLHNNECRLVAHSIIGDTFVEILEVNNYGNTIRSYNILFDYMKQQVSKHELTIFGELI